MADYSLNQALADWINEHSWPRGASEPHSIVVVPEATTDGSTFKLHASFSYFEISATHSKDASALSDVVIKLRAPTLSKSVAVAAVASYPLSNDQGASIEFDLDNGYIKGTVSIKYDDYNGQQHIFATYSAYLPYAGKLENTVSIGPVEASEAGHLTPTQLKGIQPLTSSKASTQALGTNEQALFVKYLKDIQANNFALVTYYADSSREYTAKYHLFDILEFEVSIDPSTLSGFGTLYADLPGPLVRAKLGDVSVNGSVEVVIHTPIGDGKITVTIEKGPDGLHELTIEGCIKVSPFPKLCRDVKYPLPF